MYLPTWAFYDVSFCVYFSLDESGLIQVTSIEAVFEKNITVAEQASFTFSQFPVKGPSTLAFFFHFCPSKGGNKA